MHKKLILEDFDKPPFLTDRLYTVYKTIFKYRGFSKSSLIYFLYTVNMPLLYTCKMSEFKSRFFFVFELVFVFLLEPT